MEKRNGTLVFYDRSVVSEASLESNGYMCSKESLKTVASWTFELDRGKWVSSTTLFGFETDGLCNIDDD
jgi:hypothetical protein